MTGIMNKPEAEEDARQEIVEARKQELQTDEETPLKRAPGTRGQQERAPEDQGRVSETGAGRGTEHRGH